MGSRPTGPSTTYDGTMRSPGSTATPSAMTEPPCYSLPAGGAATEKANGKGSGTQSPSNRAAPTGGQPTQDRGRQQAKEWGVRGWSASHPGGTRGTTVDVSSTTTLGASQSQPGGCAKPKHPNTALLAMKFCSSKWRKDLEHVHKYNTQAPFRESEWVRVRELFFDHFLPRKDEALAIKERSPLDYMPLITKEFLRATGYSKNSPCGLKGELTTMGCWSSRTNSRNAPT